MNTKTETRTTPNGDTFVTGTVAHEGHEYTAGGGAITDDYVICYPCRGRAQLWDGQDIGSARVTATWEYRTPNGHRSLWGRYMHSILVTLTDGRQYRGRGFGDGMILRAKRIGRKTQ